MKTKRVLKEEENFMPIISERTKNNMCSTIGLNYDEIINLDFDDEIAFVTKKNNKKPVFSNDTDKRKFGRGNPLLSRRKIKTIEEVDCGLKRIK